MLLSLIALSFSLSFLLTFFVRKKAIRFGVIDRPDHDRKIHTRPIPLLGGTAVFFAVAICLTFLLFKTDLLTSGSITVLHYAGYLLGGLILIIGGALDDKFTLPPRWSFLPSLLAVICVIAFGINIDKITNPAGGFIELSRMISDVIVFMWLFVVMYTTKLLDGVDGLATSVSSVSVLLILLLTLTTTYFQPDVSVFSSVVLGALLGFLVWNFPRAKIFLGEGGSTFLGYTIGVLSVISGSKVATALLVIGIPLLDVAWVVMRRMGEGGWRQVVKGDRKHLHHRLLDLGWSPARIVTFHVLVALAFGSATLFLQSREKVIVLASIFVAMAVFATYLLLKEKGEYEV